MREGSRIVTPHDFHRWPVSEHEFDTWRAMTPEEQAFFDDTLSSTFHVDLIAQSFGGRWTLERIDELFTRLEPLCNRQFSLTCAGIVVNVAGVRREHAPEVAALVLGAVAACRVPKGDADGLGSAADHSGAA